MWAAVCVRSVGNPVLFAVGVDGLLGRLLANFGVDARDFTTMDLCLLGSLGVGVSCIVVNVGGAGRNGFGVLATD